MKKIIQNKSIILGLAILVVLTLGLLAPKVGQAAAPCGAITCADTQVCITDATTGTHTCVDAATSGNLTAVNTETSGSCNPLNFSLDNCVGGLLAVLGNLILKLLSYVLFLAAKLFEWSAYYSLNGFYGSMPVVIAGWKICRDLANTAFVFILLYISIGTVLRLSGIKMKEMLVKTLILAIVVNFSMAITNIIIDASNVIAIEFFNKMDDVSTITSRDVLSGGGVSEKIVSGLYLPTIFSTTAGTTDVKNGSQQLDQKQGVLAVIAGTIMGSIIIIIVICIFLIATFLFVSRTVTFMFLLILSPLAFAAGAIPSGGKAGKITGYANEWWSKLIDQALFAPVFMFLLYLVVEMIGSNSMFKALQETGKVAGANGSFGAVATGFATGQSFGGATILTILNYIICIGLLTAVITVVKKTSVSGAGFATKQFDKLSGFGKNMAAVTANRVAGPISERVATGKSAQWLNRIPLAGTLVKRGAAGIAQSNREQINKQQKKYGNMTSDELKNVQPNRLTPYELAAWAQAMKKQGNYYLMKPAVRTRANNTLARYGMFDSEASANAIKKFKLDKKFFEGAGSEEMLQGLLQENEPGGFMDSFKENATTKQLKGLIGKEGPAGQLLEEYVKNIKKQAGSEDPEKISEYLKSTGQGETASFMLSGAGRKLLGIEGEGTATGGGAGI